MDRNDPLSVGDLIVFGKQATLGVVTARHELVGTFDAAALETAVRGGQPHDGRGYRQDRGLQLADYAASGKSGGKMLVRVGRALLSSSAAAATAPLAPTAPLATTAPAVALAAPPALFPPPPAGSGPRITHLDEELLQQQQRDSRLIDDDDDDDDESSSAVDEVDDAAAVQRLVQLAAATVGDRRMGAHGRSMRPKRPVPVESVEMEEVEAEPPTLMRSKLATAAAAASSSRPSVIPSRPSASATTSCAVASATTPPRGKGKAPAANPKGGAEPASGRGAHRPGRPVTSLTALTVPPAKVSKEGQAARDLFGFEDLKYGQQIGLKVVMDPRQDSRHCLFVFPTSDGKSLLYQL